jgi:hypothetical protein
MECREMEDSMKNLYVERDYWLMCFYDQARGRGEKHSAAIEEAVQEYRSKLPEVPVSSTAVRRALAKRRPKGVRHILISVPPDPSAQSQDRFNIVWLDYTSMRHRLLGHPLTALDTPVPQIRWVLDLCAGTRPCYPRHNKKDPRAKRQR